MRSLGVSRDHPRSRGEYPEAVGRVPRRSGSSPLSRGIRRRGCSRRGSSGIIPALAGNTDAPSRAKPTTRDHPRSRGEYPTHLSGPGRGWGSSPLSRGILRGSLPGPAARGIIPALAGNTLPRHHRGGGERDHPRSRGEYLPRGARSGRPGGSSPLSRGIPYGRERLSVVVRIIPALAGNTISRYTRWPWSKDHPRSRGEYDWLALRDQGVWGIIPALAGNTVVHGAFQMGRSDHPRSRGEYGFPGTPSGCFHGSSPLSRGILTAIDWQGVPRGIIPALAGNTGRAMNPFT